MSVTGNQENKKDVDMRLFLGMLVVACLHFAWAERAGAGDETQQSSGYLIEAPSQAFVTERVSIAWRGSQQSGNYITIVRPEAGETEYHQYVYTREGATLLLDMPLEPGLYELRLNSEREGRVLARRAIRLVPAAVELTAPEQAVAGSAIEVGFAGPVPEQDWITLVPAGADRSAYTEYVYCREGSPVSLVVPDRAGVYEIRYMSGFHNLPLLSKRISISALTASIEAPSSGIIGQPMSVQWEGPAGKEDYLTIVPAGTPDGQYRRYWNVIAGQSPMDVVLPQEPGSYEIRYGTGASNTVLARTSIQVLDADAKVAVPAAVVAGERFMVNWQGPQGEGDFIAIPREEAASWWSWSYAKWGNPAELKAPDVPGRYRVCYQLDNGRILAETALQVTPGNKPGSLLIQGRPAAPDYRRDVAVEVILDASGSMLKPSGGTTRMAIANAALERIVQTELAQDTRFALRVFGHREAGSCRTDLEIPLARVDKGGLAPKIGAIQARNLAKTPIADSLDRVAQDLAGHQGRALVILLTDGEETCGGDPLASIRRLAESGMPVRVNVVGFAVGDLGLKRQFEAWAQAGSGVFLDADKPEQLSRRLLQSLRPPYRVVDPAGMVIAQGTIDNEAVSLKPGPYRLEWGIGWSQNREFEISSGQLTKLEIGLSPD